MWRCSQHWYWTTLHCKHMAITDGCLNSLCFYKETKKCICFKALSKRRQNKIKAADNVQDWWRKSMQAGWRGWRWESGVIRGIRIAARVKRKVYKMVVRPALMLGLENVVSPCSRRCMYSTGGQIKPKSSFLASTRPTMFGGGEMMSMTQRTTSKKPSMEVETLRFGAIFLLMTSPHWGANRWGPVP